MEPVSSIIRRGKNSKTNLFFCTARSDFIRFSPRPKRADPEEPVLNARIPTVREPQRLTIESHRIPDLTRPAGKFRHYGDRPTDEDQPSGVWARSGASNFGRTGGKTIYYMFQVNQVAQILSCEGSI